MRVVRIAGWTAAALIGAVGLGVVGMRLADDQPGIEPPVGGPPSFEGTVAVLSDLDQQAAAYADGVLNQLEGRSDTLSLVGLAEGTKPKVLGTALVSNSVIGWPMSIAASPDGERVYVVEVRGTPPTDVDQVDNVFDDLPTGRLLSVVDIRDRQAPKVLWSEPFASNPSSIAVRDDGRMLAAGSDEHGAELVLVALDESGLPTQRYAFPIDIDPGSNRAGVRAVSWHPSGDFLALNNSDRYVEFHQIEYDDAGKPLGVTRVGNAVGAGETLTAGEFHPGGRFFLIPDVTWGDMSSPADYLLNDRGGLVVVEFDEEGQHKLVGRTEVGRSPEGFAISRSGDRVVTLNMNRTYLPNRFPAVLFPGLDSNSLTLLSFNPTSGDATVLDERGFGGLLPEDVVFDADDDALAVVVYERREDPTHGFIEYWRLERDRLVPTGHRVPVARGAHGLALVPEPGN